MSTTELGAYPPRAATRSTPRTRTAADVTRMVLEPLASLRLTVALLLLSIVLVFAGTLAQVDYEIWYVIGAYFRTWISWFEVRIFFPRSWGIGPEAVFPFPGGKLLGVALATNLVAAHGLRFKVAASGKRLALGWLTIAGGAAVTWAVVTSGANTAVESELSPSFTSGLWHALRAAVGGTALTLTYILALSRASARQSAAWWLWWLGAICAALLAGLAVYLFTHPEARLNASGLRILWQLAKATAASVVLGAGCWAVFGKRAGIVLLHGGIGLLMFSELYTAQNVVEARMTIDEGETAAFADDIRSVELAFTTAGEGATERTTVVPQQLLERAARTGEVLRHADLPFDLRVTRYLPNSVRRLLQPGETPVANAGAGSLYTISERPSATGVDSEQAVDLPSAVVELVDRPSGQSRGQYLTSLALGAEHLEVSDRSYSMALRFKRILKPYLVTLRDFKFERYIGTEMPKNFESVVRFQDPARNVDRMLSTSMNNPIRYGGDTLYQSSYDKETETTTVLQVVTNAGWMVPYVACMIVAAGMLVHFTQGIIRFIYRREDEAKRAVASAGAASSTGSTAPVGAAWWSPAYYVPALVLLAAMGTTARFARPVQDAPLEMRLADFGRLPVAYGGRTQPMDSLARNSMRVISGKATYEDSRYKERQPAIRWLLELVSQTRASRDHRVVRIENLDVLQMLDLPARPGKWRYSPAEIYAKKSESGESEFDRQARLALAVEPDRRDLAQQKMVELSSKIQRMGVLQTAFDIPDIGETGEGLQTGRAEIDRTLAALNAAAPRPVPPGNADGPWLTIYESVLNKFRERETSGRPQQFGEDDPTRLLLAITEAYDEGDAAAFNESLAAYGKVVAERAAAESEREAQLAEVGQQSGRKAAERLDLDRIAFESYFNAFDPFFICVPFYVLAFLLAVLAWVGWPAGFNRSANWLLWFTFGLHTFAILCRMYLSGRPPMTNLYSSAVFIGWAGVLIALVFEVIYKLGIGNLLAAVVGFPTMVIAYQLTMDADGDTLGVMQAVLDTNFWLSTHVVCVGLGYSTSLLSGALGMFTIVLGYIVRVLDDNQRRQITRMTYGTLCFAIFFSFIGTVLGGLWADDSWGRFWGWDPKENGALMIVLWNAIVLHARWGKMVGERGLAALSVLGNIVVAWSWWGVNQLGVGLHAYGWTSGLTFWLATFALSQLVIAAAPYGLALFSGPGGRGPRNTASA